MKLTVLLVWLVCVSALKAQESASDPGLSCVRSLELPTRGLYAAGSAASGTVKAVALIGKAGRISKLELTGGSIPLRNEVRVAMNLSKFVERCQGRTVELVFGFTLEDPPTDSIIPPAVRFLPPNRFRLVFRRVKPNLDPGRPLDDKP